MSERRRVTTADAKRKAAHARARLQVWLAPSFPVGSFAYSHGLELAAEKGWVKDRASLESWLGDLVVHGALRNDLILLAAAWRATKVVDWAALADIMDLAAALQPAAERFLETSQQGGSFIAAIEAAWPAGKAVWSVVMADRVTAYPVAVGFAASQHDLGLDETLHTYAIAFVSNLASAAIRLSIVGQTDAQRVLAALLPRILDTADAATELTCDDLGSATWRCDLASLQHETQKTRLFRS